MCDDIKATYYNNNLELIFDGRVYDSSYLGWEFDRIRSLRSELKKLIKENNCSDFIAHIFTNNSRKSRYIDRIDRILPPQTIYIQFTDPAYAPVFKLFCMNSKTYNDFVK